jgi:hypothetical protein
MWFPRGQNLVVTSVDITGAATLGGSAILGIFSFVSSPTFLGGEWIVPNDGFTHSFQYPGSGIVYHSGFAFDSSNIDSHQLNFAFIYGFLTPI